MNSARRESYNKKMREHYKDKPCAKCGKQHDHSYGIGKFCSKACASGYGNRKTDKVKRHLNKLRSEGIIQNQAEYGTWKCDKCNLVFSTKHLLREHNIEYHNHVSLNTLFGKEKRFACPFCSKEFDTAQQLRGHLSNCKKHPNKALHDKGHWKAGKTFSKRCKEGEIDISKCSHPHTLETRQHISEVRAAQVQNEYLTNFHAKVKWYKVKNLEGVEFSVRGHWEENVALQLNKLGILWIKAKPIKYFKEYWHNYTADLYIPALDIYVEVKGRYPDSDREKMRLVVKQNPSKRIYFIHDKYFDFIEGKIPFDDDLLISKADL